MCFYPIWWSLIYLVFSLSIYLASSNTVDAFCAKCWYVVYLNCRCSYLCAFTRLNDWLLGKVNLTLVQFYLWQLQIYQNSCRSKGDTGMNIWAEIQIARRKIRYMWDRIFLICNGPPMTCYIYLHVNLKWAFHTCLPFDKNVVFYWGLYLS